MLGYGTHHAASTNVLGSSNGCQLQPWQLAKEALMPVHARAPVIEKIEQEVDALISRLLESHEHRVDLSQELIAAIATYSEACADWEVRQHRAATRQKRGRATA